MAMVINTYVANSCAVSSISYLGSCNNPEHALKTFCLAELGLKDNYISRYRTLACFYIFCAGPEVKKNEVGGSHHSKDHWPKYGTEFAAYIKEHKLGDVVTVGPKYNLKHHKQSTAQAWLWSPDQAALEQWWSNTDQKV